MPGEIRFHLDECVPQAVGDGLRRRGIDVTFGTKREQSGDDDERVLRFATAEERVLVTQDADFLRLAREGHHHTGITYYVPGSRSVGELISTLVLVHGVLTADEMVGHIEFL